MGRLRTGQVVTGAGLVVLFAAIGGLLLTTTGIFSSPAPPRPSGSPRLPAVLADSPLLSSASGWAALREISKLHGKRIDAADAVVGRYSGGITVWISLSPSALAASSLLWRMNRRMAGGSEVFSAPRPQERHGRTVFVTTGLGQEHVYYQSGSTVLWLAGPSEVMDQATEELLKSYP